VSTYTLRPSDVARFWDKIRIDANGCWIWIACRNPNGYGRFYLHGHLVLPHRVTWFEFVGDIPDGLELDHICNVPACCNPAHLQAITHVENLARRTAPSGPPRKTHCKRGHALEGHNLAVTTRGTGQSGVLRRCRICRDADKRRYNERVREAQRAA
jgi:RNase P subunit RPR2